MRKIYVFKRCCWSRNISRQINLSYKHRRVSDAHLEEPVGPGTRAHTHTQNLFENTMCVCDWKENSTDSNLKPLYGHDKDTHTHDLIWARQRHTHSWPYMGMTHTHKHTHTHARTNAHTHRHTRAHTHTLQPGPSDVYYTYAAFWLAASHASNQQGSRLTFCTGCTGAPNFFS